MTKTLCGFVLATLLAVVSSPVVAQTYDTVFHGKEASTELVLHYGFSYEPDPSRYTRWNCTFPKLPMTQYSFHAVCNASDALEKAHMVLRVAKQGLPLDIALRGTRRNILLKSAHSVIEPDPETFQENTELPNGRRFILLHEHIQFKSGYQPYFSTIYFMPNHKVTIVIMVYNGIGKGNGTPTREIARQVIKDLKFVN